MTAHLRGTPHPSALPASQSAPVAEFKCLFTHDIKRKQKRWQDGYLKFHTFNSRVMVYDQSRNHIGDTYWKESNELQEGEELALDRGVLVQVEEAIGITKTDLTPLFEKKPREQPNAPPTRPTPAPQTVRPYQRPSSVAPTNPSRVGTQLRHKSLNTLLGKPRGPVGKAVPIQSPYDARNEAENKLVAHERPAKRQKITQNISGWRASSPTCDESSPEKPLPVCPRTVLAKTSNTPRSRAMRPVDVINISSEPDHIPVIHSDVTLPCLSPLGNPKACEPAIVSPPARPSAVRKPAPVQTPKIPRRKAPVPAPKTVETPKHVGPPSSPPVSASNRLNNVDFAVQSAKKLLQEPSPAPSPPRNPKARSLRLPPGVRRGTLMCQSLLQQNEVVSVVKPSTSMSATNRRSQAARKPCQSPGDKASIKRSVTSKTKKTPHPPGREMAPPRAITPEEQLPDIFVDDDDPEIMHGLLDQQLLIGSPPVVPHSPSLMAAKGLESKLERNASMEEMTIDLEELDDTAPRPRVRKPPTPQEKTNTGRALSKLKKKGVEKKTKSRASSPVPIPLLERPTEPQRDTSPSHAESIGNGLRNGSTSPTKKALSTGGFQKKPQRTSKKSTTPIPEKPAQSVPPTIAEVSTSPPPQPYASKKAPLMTTTELAAVLQKPKRRSRPVDPIEEVPLTTGKSPNRSFRRVRSENDAPIPSTSEDWEKRNLPTKPSHNTTDAETAIPAADTLPEPKPSKRGGLAALVKKTDPRRKFQRAKSLNVDTSTTAQSVEQHIPHGLPSPVMTVDTDLGPWSTEAFDLFDWRPPRLREEE